MDDVQDYLAGEPEGVWERLCALDRSGLLSRREQARAVALEAMKRVRRNIELLIPRWESRGHAFGYAWAGRWAAKHVADAPPLLGEPTPQDIAALRRFERERGPLPIVLRAFYEVVGAVNFVGAPAPGWPGQETLDPLQIKPFAPQLDRLLGGESEPLCLFPDFLLKYFIGGVGPITIRIPDSSFDPALVFEGEALVLNGKPLRFGPYLREVILHRGGIGQFGCNDERPDPDLITALRHGLIAF